jgi:hypothetical protein
MRGHAELPKVIEYLNAMSGDSNTRDNSNKQSGHREVSIAVENPFLKIKTRGLLLWFISIPILAGLVTSRGESIREVSKSTWHNIAVILLELYLFYGICWKFEQGNIDIRRFFRRISNTKWVHLSGLLFCLLLFSIPSSSLRRDQTKLRPG